LFQETTPTCYGLEGIRAGARREGGSKDREKNRTETRGLVGKKYKAVCSGSKLHREGESKNKRGKAMVEKRGKVRQLQRKGRGVTGGGDR